MSIKKYLKITNPNLKG